MPSDPVATLEKEKEEVRCEEVRCSECHTTLGEGQDREKIDETVFCRPCYNNLQAQLEQAVRDQSTDINYGMGVLGAIVGGVVGVLAWWGFTVLTHIAFGLVALVIGLAVGKGATLFAGNKRSRGLQLISVVTAALSFFYASYLVNRTFIVAAFAEGGEEVLLPLLPSLGTFYSVVSIDFGLFEILFLGIALFEAWKLPAPVKLPARST